MMGITRINAVSSLLADLGQRGYDVRSFDVDTEPLGAKYIEATVTVRLWDDGKTDNGKKDNGS